MTMNFAGAFNEGFDKTKFMGDLAFDVMLEVSRQLVVILGVAWYSDLKFC